MRIKNIFSEYCGEYCIFYFLDFRINFISLWSILLSLFLRVQYYYWIIKNVPLKDFQTRIRRWGTSRGRDKCSQGLHTSLCMMVHAMCYNIWLPRIWAYNGPITKSLIHKKKWGAKATRRKLVHYNRPLRLGHCDSC